MNTSTMDKSSLEETTLAIHDVSIIRCISAVGMVLMLYDHVLTFADEVHLVWNARPSFAKQLFLINRYVVMVSLVSTAVFTSHFDNGTLSKASCQGIATVVFVMNIISCACANILVLLRVIILWDRDYIVAILMGSCFCAAFITSLSFMILILRESYRNFLYVPHMHTCAAPLDSSKLPGVFASIMAFELLELLAVVFNALSRPRSRSTPLRRVLYRDGILFFASIAGLEALNLILSLAARPTLHTSGVQFTWALTTLVLNRSLLNIHKASSAQSAQSVPVSSSTSLPLSEYIPLSSSSPPPDNINMYPRTRGRQMTTMARARTGNKSLSDTSEPLHGLEFVSQSIKVDINNNINNPVPSLPPGMIRILDQHQRPHVRGQNAS